MNRYQDLQWISYHNGVQCDDGMSSLAASLFVFNRIIIIGADDPHSQRAVRDCPPNWAVS